MPSHAIACIPADESDRLAALQQLKYLDTPAIESFDRVTRLAARTLNIPIVLVSLVDAKRQWFKSKVGLEVSETPRDVSFCGHVVYERRPFVIPDATLDERFAANPLVTGPPYVRAYLGIPLYTRAGHAIGSLCAIDRDARDFAAADIKIMGDFAKMIEDAVQAQELAAQNEHLLRVAAEREQMFRDSFELAAIGIVHANLSGSLLRSNPRTCELLGYSAEELTNKSFVDITHPDDIAMNSHLLQRIAGGEIDSYRVEKRYVRRDGSHLWAMISVALKRNDAGQPDYLIAAIEDVTVRKQAELTLLQARDALRTEVAQQTRRLHENNDELRIHVKRLLESERAVRLMEHRLRTITDHVPAMIGYWSSDLRCEFANEAFRDWFGIPPDKAIGMTMRELLGEANFTAAEPHARRVLDGHEQCYHRDMAKADGCEAHLEIRYIPDFNEARDVRGFFVLATDVTIARNVRRALETANAKLANDSTTDFLTGLANRRAFTQRSEDAARRCETNGETYGLILLDLDNFKSINDGYGHDGGDDVLRAVGTLLRAQLRNQRDIAARLGGEEFAILCFGELDEESLCQVAERIRLQMKRCAVQTAKGTVQFSGSFGLALSQPTDQEWTAIYSRADAALFEAKSGGKDRVLFGSGYAGGGTGRFRALRAMSAV